MKVVCYDNTVYDYQFEGAGRVFVIAFVFCLQNLQYCTGAYCQLYVYRRDDS